MLGLTQQQLAELIGVTYQQAHKYETGITRIAAFHYTGSRRRWASKSAISSRSIGNQDFARPDATGAGLARI